MTTYYIGDTQGVPADKFNDKGECVFASKELASMVNFLKKTDPIDIGGSFCSHKELVILKSALKTHNEEARHLGGDV